LECICNKDYKQEVLGGIGRALAGLATSVMAFAQCDSNTIVQVTAIIGALGSVIGYLIANGLTEDVVTTSAEKTVIEGNKGE